MDSFNSQFAMPTMVPLSPAAYLESRKEEIWNKICTERMQIPKVHKWLCHRQDYWVGEGQLRYAIEKWQKAEPSQWNLPLHGSLPARPAPRLVSDAGVQRYSAPTHPLVGGAGTSGHHQMWLATSSIGAGQGSMASTYVQTSIALEEQTPLDAFFGAHIALCEYCFEPEVEGKHGDCMRF